MPKSKIPKAGAIAFVGVDIGKNTFHVVGLDMRGRIAVRQKFSRRAIEEWFANLPRCLVGMEACVGAHHLARRLIAHGHDARLMAAMFVKGFLKGNKNDFRDAEAIAEAVQRPTMHFVTVKSPEQLDLQPRASRSRRAPRWRPRCGPMGRAPCPR